MNLSAVTIPVQTAGKKCDGPTYVKLFQQSFAKIGEVNTVTDAKTKFWQNWDAESAGFHTGSAGIKKYSEPFIAAIDKAFAESAAKSTVKTAKSA